MAVCFEIHTKHINALCGQNVEMLNVKAGKTLKGHLNSFICPHRRAAYVTNVTNISCLPLELPSRIEPKFCLPSNNNGHNSD